MNNVIKNNDVGVITLKEITDLISVEHNKAMKKVEALAKEPSFGGVVKIATPTFNPDGSFNRNIYTYQLTKKQAIAVGAKLNNALLMKVIDRLEELEKPKLPQTFSAALLLASKQAEIIENQNVVLAQKAQTIQNVVHSDHTYTASQVAKDMPHPISALLLNKMLNEADVIFKQNGSWQLYSKYVGHQLTSIKETKPDAGGKTYPSLRWTALGKSWIFDNWEAVKQKVDASTLKEWETKIASSLPRVAMSRKKKSKTADVV